MKIKILIAVVGLVLLSSCGKNYNCTCTADPGNGIVTATWSGKARSENHALTLAQRAMDEGDHPEYDWSCKVIQ